MRLIPLLTSLLLCTGCASAIYEKGRFHQVLKVGSDRNQIRRALGRPVESGQDRSFGISDYDVFVLRGPVCDSSLATSAAMGAGMTMGLSEFIAVPRALWWSLTDRGRKRVQVLYSEDFHYQHHSVGDVDRPFLKNVERVPRTSDPADGNEPNASR